ncbi:phage antirepressor [Lactiplantibacillus plantarum]|uniref:phage antirepressor n=1 Tax=Lactiplantibacillus plantarum TaxID=1590 RepID=UPI00217EE5C2|nr:phage antirepressor KilAC domain-containing protein [Lactiplantibacillus plantarum]MCG0662343.1 phage repressor protein/antirepressor Ant [Lactiplantibacillus plantarum]UWF32577.1 phage antirepressor KilAC domain-containing protein [Lactiplantibacillus plantarum]UWF37983.1 phage antirepressor KilAC domain-containing protein [Lactiplantibacillus plantarum]UWF40981.1 phage antirepressor KilAC domain-containing protein [Lactiplantibacillus plantarum]WPB51007.1 phage antirepressor KilAC domain-
MNEVELFNFEGMNVQTILIDGEPYLVGKDVATLLGYKNTKDALAKHINDEDKLKAQVATSGQKRLMIMINESGLYDLIFDASRQGHNQEIRMRAKRFRHWVTSEVLPSIRKNGVYMTDEKAYDVTHNPNGLADLLMQAGEQLKQKNLVIKELQPKALFADAVATSDTSILVGELAKLLKQNGVNVGQNRLFTWLRDNGYLIAAKRTDRNMPTQRSLEHGWFEIKERSFANPDGSIRVTKTPKVTGKGQQYFINKFLKDELVM